MAAVQRPRTAAKPADPHISIVIPVYNEQAILHAAVVDLRERLKPLGWSYEVILAENGSKDRTVDIGHELAVPEVGDFHALPQEGEGRALVRSAEGVQLVSNVCRHRQAIMLRGRGNRLRRRHNSPRSSRRWFT